MDSQELTLNDLQQINNLIVIRQYIAASLNNFAIDKSNVKYLGILLSMVDKKIISLLKDQSFQKIINLPEAQPNTIANVKSSLNK